MDDSDWLAEEFEEHRPHLRAVAYRMLGSRQREPTTRVQEAWLRLSRADDRARVDNLGGWLTTVVGRVCLDMLRARARGARTTSARGCPSRSSASTSRPTPRTRRCSPTPSGLALLVVLDTLTPAERLAFVLHDMFGVPFDEIAPIVDRSPAAARQLASRARRRVRGAAPSRARRPGARSARSSTRSSPRPAAGDFEALLAVLDPDVVFRADTGPGSRWPGRRSTAPSRSPRRVLARGRAASRRSPGPRSSTAPPGSSSVARAGRSRWSASRSPAAASPRSIS